MSLRPGDTLERYVIEGVLGEGGMGVVYRARDTRLNRRVALKVLHDTPVAQTGMTTGGSARILREARTAAMLEHPNVVATYDVGEITEGPHAGTAYLAMELVDGRSLRGFVGDTSIPIVTRVRWLADAARGLHAAHERQLVHRDMKPENVIVRADGAVKVLDFGIAKQQFAPVDAVSGAFIELRTITGEGVVVGTPLYMAPEQMRGSHVDAKADQFAWGVVAYEMLTGVLPWGVKLDAISLVAAVLSNDPIDPREKNPAISDWLAQVVLRTLQKSPADRFPTMRDVVAALDTGEVGTAPTQLLPVESMRIPKFEPSPAAVRTGALPSPRRSPAIAIGAAAVAALAIGAGVLRSRLSNVSPPPAVVAGGPSGGPSAAPAVDGCASNAACSRELGAPSICRADHVCAALDSPDCHALADDVALASSDTIWVGGLYSKTGVNAEWGRDMERGADLARQDFAQALVALRAGGKGARPVALVGCDDVADVHRAVRHLVADLHVPAVIDSQNGAALVALVGSELAPNHVLDIATTTNSPLATQVPHAANEPPIVWRTSNNGAESALALAKLIETRFEPQLRASGVTRTRIAIVRMTDPTVLTVANLFFDTLRFNGQSALENGRDYREFIIDNKGTADAAYADDVSRIRTFAPQIIIAMGGLVYTHVVGPLEATWPASQTRPRYLGASLFDDEVFSLIGKNKSFRQRVFGVSVRATTAVNARFTMHYNEVFKADYSRADAPSSDYDAFYVLTYAAYALGDQPPTGPNLSTAIKHLVPPGPPVDVGPSGIFQAFSRLSAGESIDLNGAGGNLDFDLATGEHNADLAIMCIDVDEAGKARGNTESGLVYIGRTGDLVGKLHCP